MVLFEALLYLNVILITVNVLIFVEIVFQIISPNSCFPQKHYLGESYFIPDYDEHWLNQGIIGGSRTNIAIYPYIAAILIKSDIEEDYDFHCACAIVTISYALTAAHCVVMLNNKAKTKVRSGTSFWQRDGVLHDIVNMTYHENFAENFNENDIGIITVKPKFEPMQAIRVAGPNYILRPESAVTVAGWGETNETVLDNETQATSELHSVTVHVLSNNICSDLINTFHYTNDTEDYFYMYTIFDSEFCAGVDKGGKDACVYDSGGPAVQENILVGLVSHGGAVCANQHYPGVYANLINLHEWILNKTESFSEKIKFIK